MKKLCSVPLALTVAGSDCSGGAGIQADLKTFTSLGVYGTSVVTCVVAETPRRVAAVHAVPRACIGEQLQCVWEMSPPVAMKTGMLFSASVIKDVSVFLQSLPTGKRPALVVDPVMVATSGASLMKSPIRGTLLRQLLPLATVVTPNLLEAAVLAGVEKFSNQDEALILMRRWVDSHGVPCLLKGGHWTEHDAVDVLLPPGLAGIEFRAKRIKGVRTHGTGCTLSAALTAALALGHDLEQSCAIAKDFITHAIASHHHIGRETPLNQLPRRT